MSETIISPLDMALGAPDMERQGGMVVRRNRMF
jgi:hypothetical protein